MEDLKNIIKEIDSIGKELKMSFHTDMVLDCATRIFNRMNLPISMSKSLPKVNESLKQDRFKIKNPDSPMTEGQTYKLKTLGVNINKNLTKLEASKLIEEKLKSKNELPTEEDFQDY